MNELNIIKNFIDCMTKRYREKTMNCRVVHDILLKRTSTAGMTSCCRKCVELGIDPYGYTLEQDSEVEE
jgi:hypothetical protein